MVNVQRCRLYSVKSHWAPSVIRMVVGPSGRTYYLTLQPYSNGNSNFLLILAQKLFFLKWEEGRKVGTDGRTSRRMDKQTWYKNINQSPRNVDTSITSENWRRGQLLQLYNYMRSFPLLLTFMSEQYFVLPVSPVFALVVYICVHMIGVSYRM